MSNLMENWYKSKQLYLDGRVCGSERVTCYNLGYVILELVTVLKSTMCVV